MSVTAAQLIAEVTIQGADQAIGSLTEIGAASEGVQSGFDASGEAANMLAGVITDLSNQMFDSFLNMTNAVDDVRYAIEEMSSGVSTGFDNLDTSISGLDENMSGLVGKADEAATAMEDVGTAAESASSGGLGSLTDMLSMGYFKFQMISGMAQQFGQSLLGPAINAETVTTALTTMDGSAKAASDEMQKLDQFAAKTPFKTLDIDQAAEQLQGFGYQAGQVVPMITSIGDALGSVGKETPAEMMSVVDVFGKMKTEGKVTTMMMTELATHGINAWKALSDGSGKTIPQLQEMIKKGLLPSSDAVADLTKGIEMNPLYKGGMAKAAGTFTGLLSTLQSNWDQVIAAFGTPIIKGLEGSLNNIGATLASPSFQSFAGSVGQGLVNVFTGIGGAVSTAVSYLKNFDLTGISYGFKQISDAVSGILKPLTSLGSNKAASGFFTSLKNDLSQGIVAAISNVSNFLQGFAGVLKDLSNNKSVQGFLSSLVSGFTQVGGIVGGQLKQNFQTFSGIIKDLGKWWTTSMWPAIQGALPGFEHLGSVIATVVVPALAQIWAAGQKLMREIMPPLTKAFEAILPPVVTIAGWLANQLGNALKFIMPFAVQAAQAIGQFAGEIATRVTPIVQQIWSVLKTGLDWIKPYWPAIWSGIQDALTATWDTIKGVIQIAWAIVSGIIKVGLDVLSGNWKGAWNDIKTMFSGIWDGIKSIASGVWTLISKPIMDGVNGFKKWWSDSWNTVSDDFSKVLNGLGGIAQGAWNGVTGAIKSGINDVIGLINNFIGGLDNIHVSIPGGPSIGISIPKIPYLASGGYVEGSGFAVVGENGPEGVYLPAGASVVPNSQMNAMASSGNASNGPQTVILQIDGRQFARLILPHFTNQVRYGVGTVGV